MALAIGVDLGGTKIAVGVVDEDGNILAQRKTKTNPDDTESINNDIADACNALAKEYDVEAVGLTAPGFVNPNRKVVDFAPNIAYRHYPLADRVAELLDKQVPVVVENDANAAGWAEFRFGAGRGTNDMLMLTIGTGLGGALMVGGELVRGSGGMAAEVGHMRMVPGGHDCGCGHEGCWEMYASGTALVKAAKRAAIAYPKKAARIVELSDGERKNIKGPAVTLAAQEGDALALDLLAKLGRWIGEGAASVAALMDPEMVVVGGGVCAAGDLLLNPIKKGFEKQLPALEYRTMAEIKLAKFGNDAGIIGAADLARR
ncbi:MAG: ROK family glucokinase [Cellulomonadaceae bacterium]|jgi:glucokinase|nr:ROK family glucokinase [Cellulomonadaceae bacterium]